MKQVKTFRKNTLRFASPVLIVAAVCTVPWVNAGDLNPPAGAITSTMKTLDEVETARTAVQSLGGSASASYVINQPGSYYLTENITGVASKHGIRINASNVTVDLNGFALIGVGSSLSGVHAPFVSPTLRDISIVNGTVRDWGIAGVQLDPVAGCIVSNLRVYNNSAGVAVGNASIVKHCKVQKNGGHGIDVGDAGLVIDCVASSNTNSGIKAGTGTTVRGCTARNNESSGIQFNSQCLIVGNNCSDNDSSGLFTDGTANRIEGNHTTSNLYGIKDTGGGNLVIKNTASNNSGGSYVISGSSAVGQVITTAGTISADPWANFSLF